MHVMSVGMKMVLFETNPSILLLKNDDRMWLRAALGLLVVILISMWMSPVVSIRVEKQVINEAILEMMGLGIGDCDQRKLECAVIMKNPQVKVF